jgi:signal transduction histidine kinase
MRERAALLGGTLDIRSSPGAGTVVRVALPAG